MPNRIDLSGRAGIITGGARGIGLAVAKRYLDSGARVALWDTDATALSEAATSLAAGDSVVTCVVDVTSHPAVESAFATTLKALGKVDILVNNAGITGPNVKTWEYSAADFRKVIDIDLTGIFIGCKVVVPHLIANGYGRIVNVASIAGKEGNPMAGPYSSSKAAVIGLTKAIGTDVAGSGVLVNCIAPAVIDTPILGQITEEHISYMTSRIPLGRMGQPEEVAALICFLASEELTFATGACFDISGGRATY